MIREVGASVGRAIAERAGRLWSRFHEASPLKSDLLESEDAYLVVFDAPGATHSDVQVRYVDGDVLVRLDRFRDFFEDFEMVFPGRGMALDGRAKLPDDADVDPEAAQARLQRDGTLEVRVPKGDGRSPRSDVDAVEADASGASGDAGEAGTAGESAEPTP